VNADTIHSREPNSSSAPMQRTEVQTFRCFACKRILPASERVRSGRTQHGRAWHLCADCHASWHGERGFIRSGEDGWVKMGWNGTPSERSLKRRR